ncbi:MAG: hypothetical protein FMNOHCHN_03745 [Ignavibacteriaceae bacterium]|nr:hypothetical protein [Ignavibacteriaceae bacterium]
MDKKYLDLARTLYDQIAQTKQADVGPIAGQPAIFDPKGVVAALAQKNAQDATIAVLNNEALKPSSDPKDLYEALSAKAKSEGYDITPEQLETVGDLASVAGAVIGPKSGMSNVAEKAKGYGSVKIVDTDRGPGKLLDVTKQGTKLVDRIRQFEAPKAAAKALDEVESVVSFTRKKK